MWLSSSFPCIWMLSKLSKQFPNWNTNTSRICSRLMINFDDEVDEKQSRKVVCNNTHQYRLSFLPYIYQIWHWRLQLYILILSLSNNESNCRLQEISKGQLTDCGIKLCKTRNSTLILALSKIQAFRFLRVFMQSILMQKRQIKRCKFSMKNGALW